MEESYGFSRDGRAILVELVNETSTHERRVRIIYTEANGNRFTGIMSKGSLRDHSYTSPSGESLQPGNRDVAGFDELGALLLGTLPDGWQTEFGHWFHHTQRTK